MKRVKSRLQRWADGDLVSLWSEALEDARSLAKRQSRSSAPTSTSNSRRARRAAQDGRYSKAIQALTSDGLASPSPEILQEMRKKHPQAPPPSVPLDPVPSPAILSEPAVLKGVHSFPNASAPGPSGLRPSHLQEAIRCPSPDCAAQALTTLTSLVNLLAAGRAPPSVLPHLCGATLLASPKKSGGHRPIAVGEVMRRLTSKCLASTSRSSAISSLTPLQLGVGVKGGCEAIIHSTSHLLSSSNDPDQCWCLFLDFSNAFNCISRESMFAEIRQRIPHLAAWMESCYSCQPLLHQTVNRFTLLDAYPLPRIDDTIKAIAQYQVFSTIDLRSAYHQVKIKESDKPYTAFQAGHALYQFTRIPFGVTNGVACFQRIMASIIEEENLKGTIAYMDNVTICGRNQEEHDENLQRFQEVASARQITYNDSKSVFSTRRLAILGYIIENGQI